MAVPAMAVPAAAARQKSAPSSGPWLPKLSERISDVYDASALRWLRQLGARHVVWDAANPGEKGYLTAGEILKAKQACREVDLTLEAMPLAGSRLQTMLGRPGRDEEIENACRTVQAAGEAGVPTLMWGFTLDSYWDDRVGFYLERGRGGATLRAFELERVRNAPPFPDFGLISEKEMWERLLYFARPVVKAAESAGVRLALHPSDPPVRVMRGVPRVIHSPETFLRFFEEVPSPANGMTFCQGVFTEMGTDVLAEIRRFGGMGRIHLVHFRAVRGRVPRYAEVFIDEGEVNMIRAMRTYKEIGYTGAIVSDHTPLVEGDKPSSAPNKLADHGRVGTSFAHGYMRAAVQAVNTL